MEHNRERRVLGVRRVAVDRIVDICTSATPTSAFQARSIDVSGRGMHVRSSHLPALQTPLVLRFQEHGAEIIAEGEVAWRSEGPSAGGEFGVRFTALDSRSVQALKALCQAGSEPAPGDAGESEEHDTEPAPKASAGVHLHIAGLPTPMRAEIKGTRQRRLELGSALEFLRVGRNLEVEDLGLGARREARIDAVDVSVDEVSRIPELIVSVRYADVPDTPMPAPSQARPAAAAVEPSVAPPRVTSEPPLVSAKPSVARALDIEADVEFDDPPGAMTEPEQPDASERVLGAAGALDAADELEDRDSALPSLAELAAERPCELDDSESGGFDDEDDPPGPEPLRERLESALQGLSAAARRARRKCQVVGHAASRGAHQLVSRARVAASATGKPRAPAAPRRTAAAPRPALRNSASRLMRASAAPKRHAGDLPPPLRRRQRSRWIALGGLIASVAFIWMLVGRGEPEPDSLSAAERSAAAHPAGLPADVSGKPPADGEAVEPEEKARPVILPGDTESEEGAPGEEPRGELALVPLFGPTSLGEQPVIEEPAPSKERALSRVKVADQTFRDSKPAKPRPKPQTRTEFGHGRLHLPIVYRLRLDEPGGSLRGEPTAVGFDVVIVGRKTMESGSAISGRDRRIAKVITRNGPEGTRVSFRFKGAVPPYKVRLRKDFVEFFISS